MSSRVMCFSRLWLRPAARRSPVRAAGRRLGLLGRRRLLDPDVERELVDPKVLGRRGGDRLDFDELGTLQPGRGFDVAHQRGDACARLRVADERDLGAGLAQRLEIDPVGELPHHLVEQMDSLGPIGLQRFDDLLPREQRLRLLAELVDLLDLAVELRYLRLEQAVAAFLALDLPAECHVHEQHHRRPQDGEPDRERDELPLARLSLLLAVRQQVDANHSKPRSASPQAIMSSGASCASCRGRTRSDAAILANGLAMTVATPARLATRSSIPGRSAQPPASTI